MNERSKGHSQLVIASSNPAKSLQFIEEALHQVPLFIGMEITMPRIGAATLWRNGIYGVLFRDILTDCLCAVSLVTEDIAAGNVDTREQIHRRFGIMYLPACEHKVHRVPQGIYDHMDFGGLSAPAGANKLVLFRIYSPFFAPALCGWALIAVLSMQRFS